MKKILLSVLALLAFTFGGTAQTLPSYVPANGLVGWWPFNGNANDESGNNNNGTVNGATLTADRFGNAGKAYGFDGDQDFIVVENSNSLNPSQISFSFWANFTTDNSAVLGKVDPTTPENFAYTFIHNYSGNSGGFLTHWNTSGSCAYPVPSVGQTVGPAGIIQNSVWNHIVVVIDGNGLCRHFINGTLAHTFSDLPLNGCNNSNSKLYFGRHWGGGPIWMNGSLDDIAIYNRALSPTEITQLYTGQVATTANCPTFPASLAQGLVGYWPFCGNALDESGNNNHGTVNGASLTTDRFGNAGSAYGFDGVNDRIEINNNPVFNQGPISVSAWVRVNNIGFYDLITKDGQGNPNTRQWTLQTNNKLPRFGAFSNNGEFTLDGQDTLVSQKWVHLVGVYSLTEVKIFQNGIQVGSLPMTGILAQGLEPLRFGGNVVQSNYFDGSLDDIAIWNRALTPQEIQQVYNQGICQTSITVTDTLLIHTGITSYNPVAYQNTLKVWPNPGNTAITLDAGNLALMQGWKIRISNAQGAQIYPATGQSGLISQQQQTLSMSDWGGNGLYFLYLIDPQNNIQEVKKIVLAP